MGWPQSADIKIRGNLAEMPLPLSLADAAVDPFPQQVGVAAVTGVLLDHVDQNRAQRDASAIPIEALDAQVGGIGDELLREGHLVAPGAAALAG
jgi:hypothetical protein